MITIVSATNRPNSATFRLAQYYQKQLNQKAIEAGILSLTDLPADIIESDLYGKRTEQFQKIQDLVSNTEKFIFIMPEYNGSFPGVLKIFIDACKFPDSFYNKKAALVGLASGRYGNLRGLDHFTGVANHFNLHIMPMKIHIPAIHLELNEAGELHHEGTMKFVADQIDRFIQF